MMAGGHQAAYRSAMEPCSTYKRWHDKQTVRTFQKPGSGMCLHFYFYFIDEELGLCNVRVPTWLPRFAAADDGNRETRWAAMQKNIYSLPVLCRFSM